MLRGMRRLRYNVAATLDGFIAGPDDEFDWIPHDETIDFAALFAEFDTFVMGRRTWEATAAQGPESPLAGRRVVVVSRTLAPEAAPGATIVREGVVEAVTRLKAEEGKDVWLFGGGALFRTLLDAGLVDTVEFAVTPVILGGGVPLVTPGPRGPALRLASCKPLPSGIVMLAYEVTR